MKGPDRNLTSVLERLVGWRVGKCVQGKKKEKKKKELCYYQYTSGAPGTGEKIVKHMPPGGGIENIRQ